MEVLARDIKKGDSFRYVCDWDLTGNPILSQTIKASDDAIIIAETVMVPFGGEQGRCFMAKLNSTVEKIDATE